MGYVLPDIQEQRPDWVMCGVPWPEDGKVSIIASTELSHAELEAQRDLLDPIDPFESLGPIAMSSPMRYTLRVGLRSFVLIVADTYEQAFRSLFEQWSPRRAAAAIGGSRREITG